MEKFILSGRTNVGENFLLRLPSAKTFETVAVKNVEPETYPKELIMKAVMRRREYICQHEKSHVNPSAVINNEYQKLPKTLQDLLNAHHFPLNQGPIVFPLDTSTESRASESAVLLRRTIFSHSVDQPCGLWVPKVFGPAAWTLKQDEGTFTVTESKGNITAAASRMDMVMVFTCQLQGCEIECPCHVCRAPRSTCCNLRKYRVFCKSCSSQCPHHQIGVPHAFDAETNAYTIVTEKMSEYRYAHGYAGIPNNCKHCSADLLEHQVLHLVSHDLCRFCRYETRPLTFGNKSKNTINKFRRAERSLTRRDDKTCSVCLIKLDKKSSRVRHEKIIHGQEVQEFMCELCPKSFGTKRSLDYHARKHQDEKMVEFFECELCDKQFSTTASLSRHKTTVHRDSPAKKLPCKWAECGQMYESIASLKRHMREQHFDIKFNTDFHEGFETPDSFECEKCNKKFKRADTLRRHFQNVHTEDNFSCSECGKMFGRKDNLARHLKLKH